MINSYNLSLLPKIVFIHGLNNSPNGFYPLMNHFKNLGFETEMIILPGHGDERTETQKYNRAFTAFDQSMKKFVNTPYYVIAFSHGALYLQLWLEKNQSHKPLKQILLAPALFINRQKMVGRILKILPAACFVMSLSPKQFRRYQLMKIWEYRNFYQGMETYQKLKAPFKIPTMVMIDPKDELVDAHTLKKEIELINPKLSVIFKVRNYLRGLGSHHIMFHPDFFSKEDWPSFLEETENFFKAKS